MLLILCSKFAKKIVCRPGSARTRCGSLQRSPRHPSWIMRKGGGNGDGREGGEGRERKGQGEGGEGKEREGKEEEGRQGKGWVSPSK